MRSTLRLRPDRIIVGEVRGAEALDMLKAWNTGHPGGIATVHANSARAALYRLEQLIQEVVVTVPRRLIAEAIDMIVFIAGPRLARRIETIAQVTRPRRRRRLRTHRIHSPNDFRPFKKENPMPVLQIIPFARACALAIAVQSIRRFHAPTRPAPTCRGSSRSSKSWTSCGAGRQDRGRHHHHRDGPDLAFGETAGGFRKMIQIVFGLSIAFAASSFFLIVLLVRRRRAAAMTYRRL